MRAFLTGATGFLGSHLCRLLVESGDDVAVLMRLQSDAWRIADVLDRVNVVRGDITTIGDCEGLIAAFRPDVIYHLGWHGVFNTARNDSQQWSQNIAGGVSLAGIAIRSGCGALVGIGSQAEYGPCSQVIDESASTNPTAMYGAAKLALYHLCRATLWGSGVRFAWIRLFSSYGPMDNPAWLIPYLITKLLNGEKPSLTHGEQKWDYVYVRDAAEAVADVGRTSTAEGLFNLGSGQAQRLRDIVESIRDMIDTGLPLGFGEVPYRSDQVMHLEADTKRLTNVTGWYPRTSLAEGLRKTVDWHRKKGR